MDRTAALACLRSTSPSTAATGADPVVVDTGYGWFSIVLAAAAGFVVGSWNRNPAEGPKQFAESTSRGFGKLQDTIEARRQRS